MNHMTGLIMHSLQNPTLTPTNALDNWNAMMASANPNTVQQTARLQGMSHGTQQPQQAGLPPGVHPSSAMGHPGIPPNQQFMSPAMHSSLLPNGHTSSPNLMQQSHTPSPASHAMAHQQSQSSNTASNTSPSLNNKRRRSTAKIDTDDGGGESNGAPKVKPSPRIGGNKRVKGNN